MRYTRRGNTQLVFTGPCAPATPMSFLYRREEREKREAGRGRPPERLGWRHVAGIEEETGGGIPRGFWVTVFGPPGSYKTLHALDWCTAGGRCVYVSTEMRYASIIRQLDTMGWMPQARMARLSSKLVNSPDYGSLDIVVADIDTLYEMAYTLRRSEGGEEGGKRRYWWNDPQVLVATVAAGLEAVGALFLLFLCCFFSAIYHRSS